MLSDTDLSEVLSKHSNVPGVSIAIATNSSIRAIAAGYARVSTNELLTPSHYLQCASLSKTIATAFAIDYFFNKGVPLSVSVNSLLESSSTNWRIQLAGITNSSHDSRGRSEMYSGDDVTLAMLVNHTALGMHYVYGIPMSHPTPSPLELLNGSYEHLGFKELFLTRQPGVSFAYSGGGFIVLQLLIESLENKPIQEVTRGYLDRCGLHNFTFVHENIPGVQYAWGHIDRNTEVQPNDYGRLKFAPFAAGAVCTPECLLQFLLNLGQAYHNKGSVVGGIRHDVAVAMLGEESLLDLGAVEFMRAKVGLGVFVANAGPNKIMLHQAANDGFRGVYMVCFDGPDKGNGFVILCNGDNPAVYLQCELSRILLSDSYGKGLSIRGINFNRLESSTFNMSGLKQETIVNLGLRDLVMAAFDDPYADSVIKTSKSTRSRL